MSHPSDSRLLVLHGLRLKGFASADAVAEIVGLDPSEVEHQLIALVDEGYAQHREGRITGFAFTPAGRSEHERLLAGELDSTGTRVTIDHCYRRFLALNDELLGLCTAWQLRDVAGASLVNDHSDEGYDNDIIGRLVHLDEQAQPICADLGAALDRMVRYGARLRNARERVQAGDAAYFAAPMIASYHTVWFELHEDLLATLGIARSS
jgi:hypothetical protein